MGFFSGLKSALGFGPVVEPEQRAMARQPADPRIVKALPLSLQLQRIGGGLTPAQVSDIFRQADIGYMWRLVDLANEARQKDCHLQSVLQTREIALQGLPWQILPAKGGDRLKDRKRAEFVEDALRGCLAFESLIGHLAGGDYYGYAVAETLYGKSEGKIVPEDFSLISPRRFVFDMAAGRLRQWDAAGGSNEPYPGIDLLDTYPGKFIQFQPRIVGDVACREGLVRPLMWAALFRNWDLRDWLTLAELAWKPWRVGVYQKAASKEDIANLEAMLEQMTATGVAVVPETAKADVHWPANSGKGNSAHKELFDAMGAEMSKCVLGQTLTTEQGDVGSQALGKVHNEVRQDIRDARARAIAACLRRHLIAPLIKLNFGADALVPEFRFLTEDSVDMVAFSTMLLNVSNPLVRMPVPVAWARARLGVPEPEDDEEVLGPEEPEPGAEDVPIDPATGLPAVPDDGSQENEAA